MQIKITKDGQEVLGVAHKAGAVIQCSAKTARRAIAAGGAEDVAGAIDAETAAAHIAAADAAPVEHSASGARRVSTVPGFARTPAPAKKSASKA